jgi:hypothetical protein
MAIYRGEIAAKRIHLQLQIEAVNANSIVGHVGGTVTANLRDEDIFHSQRMELMNYAASATEPQINSLVARHTALLPVGAIDDLHGDVREWPRSVIGRLSYLELLELVLGTHPGQVGRPYVDDVLTSDEIAALFAQVPIVGALDESGYEALKDSDDQMPDPTI